MRVDGTHVALIGNQLESLVRFRGPLIAELVGRGARVTAICPGGDAEDREALGRLGAEFAPVRRLSRTGVNPAGDVAYLRELTAILRRLRPSCQLAFFIKPVVWGALAGRLAGVPVRIGLIEGLGYAYAEGGGLRRRLARAGAGLALRAALPLNRRLVTLNRDDAAMFAGMPGGAGRVVRIDGVGVDLDHFATAPPFPSPPTFTLAARLIREKGVDTFAAAARLVRRERSEARFLLLGGFDDAPSAIRREEVEAWESDGLIEWRGRVADVRPALAETSVFVLPSRYREGLPRSVMEAMAVGRPAIVSSAPGCRDAVTDGVSGRIVPAGDPEALADAMRAFIDEPERIAAMGAAARAEAERRFDVRRANAAILSLLFGGEDDAIE